ncbi:MAG: response regulator [Planctomycetota bacterium]|jgi:excisionase family DNA binding protein
MRKRSWKGRTWVSTLEAAKLLGICHMTVIRRFDAGDLKGFRVPGSRYRRILKTELADYARENGLPEPDFGESPAPARPHDDSVKRALVVEDDGRMANLMAKFLRRSGWDVTIVDNGFDAGLMAGTLRPLLVLLDIMLPGLDGREACKQMRANPELTNTRILAVTALRDEDSINEIFDAGADSYLPKPFSLKELGERVEELAGNGNGKHRERAPVKDSGASTDEL